MIHIIVTSKPSFCLSILTMQNEDEGVLTLPSIILKKTPLFFHDYCLGSVHALKQI